MALLEIASRASAPEPSRATVSLGSAWRVRARILREHDHLRSLLGAVVQLCGRTESGQHAARPTLCELGAELYRRFSAHLAFEDEYLLPLVHGAGGWGRERARRLVREHAEQRMLVEYLAPRLADASCPRALLEADLASFAELLRDDMVDEESNLLLAAPFAAMIEEDLRC
jgi:hemerythrin-like domain-containing protein